MSATWSARLFGRSHPQTVSLFGPELIWKPHLPMAEPIFRHPDLDFATIHIYQHGTIDFPLNTVDPAIDFGRIDGGVHRRDPARPALPRHRARPDPRLQGSQEDPGRASTEMFRHMQWAHLASGGGAAACAGPTAVRTCSPGMRRAEAAMSRSPAADRLATFPPARDQRGGPASGGGRRCRRVRLRRRAPGADYLLRTGPFDAR